MRLSGRRRPSTLAVLAGLAAGVAVGLLARGGAPPFTLLIAACDVAGTLFVNAIRMTVVPLVVGLLVAGLGSMHGGSAIASLGRRALLLALLPLVAASVTMLLALPLLARLPIDAAGAAALRDSATHAAANAPASGLRAWLLDLIPANPIKAAADGALLPLIVFTLAFGLAASRISAERRAALVAFFGALADAMLIVVRWVVSLAPLGVFALTAPLAAHMGADVAGAFAGYILVSVGLTLVVLAVLVYPLAATVGGVSLARFAGAIVPAQSLALSSRSTMATLPAMIDATRTLGVAEPVVAVVVPLAATMLRVGSAVGQTVAVLFAARLFGVTLPPTQLVSVLMTTVLTTFAAPGVPGGSIIVMVPILAAAGIPESAVGILLGADAIPDMVRTMANVTGGIAAALIAGRGHGGVTERAATGQ